jgi:hypothetical protein
VTGHYAPMVVTVNRPRRGNVVVVAIVLLASCSSGGHRAARPEVTTVPRTTTTMRAEVTKHVAPTVALGVDSMDDAGTWRAGDCLSWMQGGMPTTSIQHVVPCSAPHLVEVAGAVRVSAKYVHYPTDAEWRFIAQHDCLLLVAALLGGLVKPDGRYYATALRPLPIYWAQYHYRRAQCAVAKWGVTPPKIQSELSPFVGRAEGPARARTEHIGACEDGDFVYTACTNPHTWELTGYLDLTGLASTRPANDDAWMHLVGSRCEQIGRSYLAREYGSDEQYAFIQITPERWSAGARAVECFTERVDASGHAVTMTGSLRNR